MAALRSAAQVISAAASALSMLQESFTQWQCNGHTNGGSHTSNCKGRSGGAAGGEGGGHGQAPGCDGGGVGVR